MKNSQLLKQAIFNSFGVLAYIFIVTTVIRNVDRIMAGQPDNPVIAPIAFLLLFIFSALFTGGLILGRPIMLYLDGKKREGVFLLLYTAASLFVWLILAFITLFLLR